ncbi:hypothetical protein [Aurantiacibacter gangjinensis]|uniref:Uncharacterized protein n=1 Tax=Aurantiacibacter gangjinensis TaxID=502682 RepID=A0A0G9MNY2_9SPHN|nr:hypothetical protein [Aurantiacibacter gangjinensis]APE29416.1 hypothetical protein BMF35_b0161 [Aurantiacibacter gangjinensis]KLE31023.1 hypothetical protein AAW01_12205 [Aurantiacibacter gangjinensis]
MTYRKPVGYFVHHQGRGHAERSAAIANALIGQRPVTLFCARDDIFPELDERIALKRVPSLFEPIGDEVPALANVPMPDTVHCAPLGWHGITQAVGTITDWFNKNGPALFITDVSAELAQLARIASVPHVCVLQHGNRNDAGHMAAYQGAVGLIAPYHEALEQDDRPAWMRAKTHYAPGIGGAIGEYTSRDLARQRLGLEPDEGIVLVIAGGGGEGTPNTPLTLGARAEPDTRWITIGKVRSEWHETAPGNLEHRGWVDNPQDWIAAADRVVSSCGNTTVQMVCSIGRPWLVVPEWRYFDEQVRKAEALEREGLAAVLGDWPSDKAGWERAWAACEALSPEQQASIVESNAAQATADWIDRLVATLWQESADIRPPLEVVA